MAYANGTASIRHADTGQVYEINADELDWDAFDGDEREMGSETFHSATVEHPELGTLMWEVVEYPVGTENMKETDVGPHTVVKNFDFGLGNPDPKEGDAASERVPELVEWFLSRYEDPANSLPYVSAEGGYQWVEGGPYDASEVLQENFPEMPFEVIELAVSAIEEDGITDWARQRGAEDYNEDFPEDDEGRTADAPELGAEIPPQSPGTQFGVMNDGLIGMIQAATPPAQMQKVGALLSECSVAASKVADTLNGTNAHADLLVEIQRYMAALAGPKVSIARLFAIGAVIENLQTEIAIAAAAADRSDLPTSAKSRLSAFLIIHASVIAGTAEGREIVENVWFYAQATVDSQELRQRSRELSEALAASSGLVNEEAKQEIASVASHVGRGRDPKRSTAHSTSTTGNVLKIIFAVGLPTLGFVLLEGFAGTLGGAAAIQAATGAMNTAASAAVEVGRVAAAFISKHLDTIRSYAAVAGSEMVWLSHLCDWVRARMTQRPLE